MKVRILHWMVVCLLVRTAGASIPLQDYVSYLGGRSDGYGTEHVFGVAVGPQGNLYAAGFTDASVPEPVRRYGEAGRGGFVTMITPNGSERLFTTYFQRVEIIALARVGDGALFALGHLSEPQTFITLGEYAGGYTDAVLLKLDEEGELIWARYFGGSDLELPRAVAVDATGAAYIAGYTTSTNLATTAGALQRQPSGGFDGFVAKFSPAGELVYATYLAGESSENAMALAVDGQGRAIVAGATGSEALGGSAFGAAAGSGGGTDAFVCRLNTAGSAIDWAAKIGGENRDAALSLALAPNGDVIVLGITQSSAFPAEASALQSTLLGTSDLFLARLSANGQQWTNATYFGSAGSEDLGDPFYVQYVLDGESQDRTIFPEAAAVAVSASGEIHVAARTSSEDWPWVQVPRSFSGNREGYYTRLSPAISEVLEFRFVGGASDDDLRALALDQEGNRYLGGSTFAPVLPPFLPVTPGAFQTNYGGSAMDGFVAKISAAPEVLGNDLFQGRWRLAGERAGAMVRIDTAALEPKEPPHGEGASKSVWFSWTAPADGRAIATAMGSSFPAKLSAYAGGSVSTLALLGKVEETEARLMFPVEAGTEYQFSIVGDDSASGWARVSVEISEPLNDDFANAAELAGFPVSASGSNVRSTAQPGEPGHDQDIPARSVWWKWTAPTDGSVAVSTAESRFDTVLAIYTGSSLESLQPVASNDNANEDLTSEAVFLAESGQNYWIAVAGPPDEFGSILLRITSNEPPTNDAFDTAGPLSGFAERITASNARATFQPGEPSLTFTNAIGEVDPSFGRATVWWSWFAPAEGRVRIDTIGSDFDTRLGVYIGTALTNLQLLEANQDIDRPSGQRASRVEFDVQAGGPYLIQVDGSSGESMGVIKLNLRLSFPPRIFTQTVHRTPEGNLRFRAQGVPGVAYRYQSSADLRTWNESSEAVMEVNGVWEFTVPGNAERAFVRLAGPED